MYFLAKNLRNCSKTFRSSSVKGQLYKNGVLNWEYLAKNISYFITHPEQIKAKLKEKDAHMLCQFFDSEEYKSRVSQFLEMQGKILSKDTITGIKPPGSVTYQHVLSCAQPHHKKPKMFVDVDDPSEATAGLKMGEERRRRVKRCTIFEELMNRKGKVDMPKDSDCVSVKSESNPKRFRQRSTIMPIFLKKIKQRHQQQDMYEIDDEAGDSENLGDLTDQTARRLKRIEDQEPLFAQILHRTNMRKNISSSSQYNISIRNASVESERPSTTSSLEMRSSTRPYRLQTKEPSRLIEIPVAVKLKSASFKPDNTQEPEKVSYRSSSRRNVLEMVQPTKNCSLNNMSKPPGCSYKPKQEDLSRKLKGSRSLMPLRMASSRAKMPSKSTTTTKLCPRKNMNLKNFSEFLCVEPVKPLKMKKLTDETKGPKIHVVKPELLVKSKSRKKMPIQVLMERLQGARALSLKNNIERKNSMRQVMSINEEKRQRSGGAEVERSSLFSKVKLGTSKADSPDPDLCQTPKPISFLDKVILRSRRQDVPKPIKPKPSKNQESFTYKIVSQNRERREAKMRKQFKINPPYWQHNMSVSGGYKSSQCQTANELEGMSTRSHFLNFERSKQDKHLC